MKNALIHVSVPEMQTALLGITEESVLANQDSLVILMVWLVLQVRHYLEILFPVASPLLRLKN
jgi:hypothetical protein